MVGANHQRARQGREKPPAVMECCPAPILDLRRIESSVRAMQQVAEGWPEVWQRYHFSVVTGNLTAFRALLV